MSHPTLDLVSITLCNIVGYQGKHTFHFEPGLTGVIGANGSGKSTILNFIPFLLWGKTDIKLSEFLNTDTFPDTTGKEECYASLDFNVGSLHRITRSIDGRGKNMSHRLDIFSGEYPQDMYSKSEKEIAKYMLGLTHISQEMALCSTISLQEKTAYFFTLSNPDQKEMIDSFLQSQYEIRQTKIKDRMKLFDDRANRLDRFVKNLKTSIDEHNTKKNSTDLLILNVRSILSGGDITSLEAKISEIQGKKAELEASISSVDTLKKSVVTSRQQVTSLQDKLISLDQEIIQLTGVCDGTLLQIGNADTAVKRSLLQGNATKKVPKPSQKDLDGVKEQLKYYTAFFNNYSTEVTTSQKMIEVLDSALSALEESGKKIKTSVENGICHACGRPGADTEHLEKELTSIRSAYKEKTVERQAQVAKFEEDLKKKNEFQLLKTEWDAKLTELDGTFKKHLEANKVRVRTAADLRRDYRKLLLEKKNHKVYAADLAEALKSLPEKKAEPTRRIPEIEKEIADMEKLISGVSASESTLAGYRDELRSLEATKNTLISAQAQLLVYEKEVVSIKEKVATISARADRSTQVHKEVFLRAAEYKFMKKVFDTGYEKYFSQALKIISTQTNEILREIQSPLSADISCVAKGKGSTITTVIKKRGRPISFNLASGGQKVVLGICFRMALWRFINASVRSPISFFILDEVFGSLDPNNSTYVFNQIVKLKKHFKYVILTSHTDHVWNTDNKITVS